AGTIAGEAGAGSRTGGRPASRAEASETALKRLIAARPVCTALAGARTTGQKARCNVVATSAATQTTPTGKAAAAIQTSSLTKRYGETLAVDRLDLNVSRGEVYGFLGPNGAGNTTTIRMLLGLHRPTAGSATLFGIDAWRDPVTAHRNVAYVAGEPALWPQLTAEETLIFLARLHGSVDAGYRQALVKRFDLDLSKKV